MADGSPSAQKRFVHTMDLFFKAVMIRSRDRVAGVIPDLEEYIALRRDDSGCKPCFAFIEYANGLDLPDEVMEHPIVHNLYEAANDLVTWSNVRAFKRTWNLLRSSYLKNFRTFFHIAGSRLAVIRKTWLRL